MSKSRIKDKPIELSPDKFNEIVKEITLPVLQLLGKKLDEHLFNEKHEDYNMGQMLGALHNVILNIIHFYGLHVQDLTHNKTDSSLIMHAVIEDIKNIIEMKKKH